MFPSTTRSMVCRTWTHPRGNRKYFPLRTATVNQRRLVKHVCNVTAWPDDKIKHTYTAWIGMSEISTFPNGYQFSLFDVYSIDPDFFSGDNQTRDTGFLRSEEGGFELRSSRCTSFQYPREKKWRRLVSKEISVISRANLNQESAVVITPRAQRNK